MPRQCFSFITAVVLVAVFAVGSAMAANGTLSVTFKNAGGGAEQNAYVYLRNAAVPPPVEKFFSPADYIFGPSDAAGLISVSVPAGQYFIRIIKRSSPPYKPLGPPEPADLTWMQVSPITIASGSATNLGTKTGGIFRTSKISGTVTNSASPFGPLAGKYVRAQTVQCARGYDWDWGPGGWTLPNYCGPVKILAEQRTDANGAYSMSIKTSGTYYLVVSDRLGKVAYFDGSYTYNNVTKGRSPVAVYVGAGVEVIKNLSCQTASDGTCL